jgi:hypothetical protein
MNAQTETTFPSLRLRRLLTNETIHQTLSQPITGSARLCGNRFLRADGERDGLFFARVLVARHAGRDIIRRIRPNDPVKLRAESRGVQFTPHTVIPCGELPRGEGLQDDRCPTQERIPCARKRECSETSDLTSFSLFGQQPLHRGCCARMLRAFIFHQSMTLQLDLFLSFSPEIRCKCGASLCATRVAKCRRLFRPLECKQCFSKRKKGSEDAEKFANELYEKNKEEF